MATIEETLVATLKADTALNAVINGHIWPQKIPDSANVDVNDTVNNDLPCLVYRRIVDIEMVQVPVAFPQFQITVFDSAYGRGASTVRLLKNALHRYKGGDIIYASFQAGQDLPDPDVEDLRMFPCTFRITHFIEEV